MRHLASLLLLLLLLLGAPGLDAIAEEDEETTPVVEEPAAEGEGEGEGESGDVTPVIEEADDDEDEEPEPMSAGAFAGLQFRSLGPALMSGRIGDIAVDPTDHSRYFVAACSGGVWRTLNAGTTFEPVFDGEGSYSIGCLAIDPTNPQVVWVGTGENNSQRSVSFGDGVYRSLDGGTSWKKMGLPESEHIGMIAIDPRDGDTVYVASQGPLWRAGGDRGLYKTTDGGVTWTRILHISDDTGINEVHLDPRDPDTLYVSSYQRRRHVWTLINGGPEGSIFKSTDAGATWRKIAKGLPGVDLGRIGLEIAPSRPDTIYAIVEAADGKSGFFRSTNRGESWERRSKYVAGGPQYYNEIVCDPQDADRVYSLDTFMHVTEDGGKTFKKAPRHLRHVDDHALWINPQNTRHMRVGCDGGVYESFDRGENWGFKTNLPVTQFYRVSVDNSEPFYFVYGGTQDNNTQGGPSRTTDKVGIANSDWFVTVGGDGYETQVDPTDPNIVYSQWQYGGLVRHDRRSGERVDIRPRAAPGEAPLRWNWDSPLLLSPHAHTRLYFAANKLFRSDDRGDSWRAISGDLTRQIDRNQLPVMGVIQRPEAVAKDDSTSFYGNCVSLTESPLVEDLLYIGTDDGLVHVSEDGGQEWRRIAKFPGVPEMTYVSCLTASPLDPDTVYATFDNHKQGDFTPYILKSSDRGRTWTSIRGDMPDREVVYCILEDHVKPGLLFAGTEFGAWFSLDGGAHWIKFKGGVPTIQVRDIAIQQRENDLVLGTFGRGFYVLDDYSPLRSVTPEQMAEGAQLFAPRTALSYIPRNRLGGRTGRGWQGASFYAAENPPYGAVFTYHLAEKIHSRKEWRQKLEKEAREAGLSMPYPSMAELRDEDNEIEPQVWLIVKDDTGAVVARVKGPRGRGFHRVAWNLRYPDVHPTELDRGKDKPPWWSPPVGMLALPGTYTVALELLTDGRLQPLAPPQPFDVVPLDLATFTATDRAAVLSYQRRASHLQRAVLGTAKVLGEWKQRVKLLRAAALNTPREMIDPLLLLAEMEADLKAFHVELNGDPTLRRRDTPAPRSIRERVADALSNQLRVTSAPTATQQQELQHAEDAFEGLLANLRSFLHDKLTPIEFDLEAAGAPFTPGRLPDWQR